MYTAVVLVQVLVHSPAVLLYTTAVCCTAAAVPPEVSRCIVNHKGNAARHEPNLQTTTHICTLTRVNSIQQYLDTEAAYSRMSVQSVAATRGSAELCCWKLLFFLVLQTRVSTILIGYYRRGRPVRHYYAAISNREDPCRWNDPI